MLLSARVKWFLSYFTKVYVMGCKPVAKDELEILHLSSNFLVVNKCCDIPINSETPEKHPMTVATQLNHVFPHLSDPTVKFGFRFCHRLDYSTSGILCIALNKNAAREFYFSMSSNKISKYYLALVYGHVSEDITCIDKAIGTDSRPEHTHRMCTSDKDYCQDAKKAISKLLVLQRGMYNGKPASKLLFKLVTGRRHQLRVHCHEIGHTIVGDYTYSNREDIVPYRMFLHSFCMMIPNKLEELNIITEDPFSEQNSRNRWISTEKINELNMNTLSHL